MPNTDTDSILTRGLWTSSRSHAFFDNLYPDGCVAIVSSLSFDGVPLFEGTPGAPVGVRRLSLPVAD